jgi:hypothetical protein
MLLYWVDDKRTYQYIYYWFKDVLHLKTHVYHQSSTAAPQLECAEIDIAK